MGGVQTESWSHELDRDKEKGCGSIDCQQSLFLETDVGVQVGSDLPQCLRWRAPKHRRRRCCSRDPSALHHASSRVDVKTGTSVKARLAPRSLSGGPAPLWSMGTCCQVSAGLSMDRRVASLSIDRRVASHRLDCTAVTVPGTAAAPGRCTSRQSCCRRRRRRRRWPCSRRTRAAPPSFPTPAAPAGGPREAFQY